MKASYCTGNEETTNCAKLIGMATQHRNNGVLLSHENSLLSSNDNCLDVCSFLSDPTDAAIVAFCKSSECAGAIAFEGSECAGIVAFAGGDTCGSVASSSGSSCGGGGCSYSC